MAKKQGSRGPKALLGRRDVLSSLAAGVTGAVVTPGPASGLERPTHERVAHEGEPLRFLDAHRLAMLEGLAETLVPGSRAAGVADLLDRLLAVEPAEARLRFSSALGAFDREARSRYGKSWAEIGEGEQQEILLAASSLAPSVPPPRPWTRGEPVEREEAPTPPANLRDHFDVLRNLVARAYYTTEPGMRELGFTGRMGWSSLPDCDHPGGDPR